MALPSLAAEKLVVVTAPVTVLIVANFVAGDPCAFAAALSFPLLPMIAD